MSESGITPLVNFIFTGIGALIGYGTAVAVAVRKERNEAAIEFQAAFHPTLAKIDSAVGLGVNDHSFPGQTLVKILEEDFPRHVMAYQKFRQYLTEEKRIKFDTAWSEYCHYKTEDGKVYVHLGKYFNPAAYANHLKERDEAVKNIRNLLYFAELNHKSPFGPDANRYAEANPCDT